MCSKCTGCEWALWPSSFSQKTRERNSASKEWACNAWYLGDYIFMDFKLCDNSSLVFYDIQYNFAKYMWSLQTNRSMVSYDPLSEQKRFEIRQQVRKYLDGSIDEIDVSRCIK